MAQITEGNEKMRWGWSVERVAATMPKWPAYVMLGAAAACAYPAVTTPPAVEPETYRALGQEPGWALLIANGQIDYAGDYGTTRIVVPRPQPRTTSNGRRYETRRLTVDITHTRCNDGMSGRAYADTVTVTADGKTARGCGGERQPQLDS